MNFLRNRFNLLILVPSRSTCSAVSAACTMAITTVSYVTFNYTLNANASEPKGQSSYIYGVITVPICITAFVGSILCTVVLWRSGTKKQLSAKAVFTSSCVASFLFSLVLIVHSYTTLEGDEIPFNHNPSLNGFCNFVGFLFFISAYAAVCCQPAVAVNRIAIVVLAEKFPQCRSKQFSLILALIPWLLTVGTLFFPLFKLGGVYEYNQQGHKCSITKTDIIFTRYYRIFFPLGSFAIMIFCYGAVLVKVYVSTCRLSRHHDRQQSRAGTDSSGKQARTPTLKSETKMEQKVTRIALITCMVFFVCHSPQMLHGFAASSLAELQGPVGQSFILINWTGIALMPWITAAISFNLRRRVSPNNMTLHLVSSMIRPAGASLKMPTH